MKAWLSSFNGSLSAFILPPSYLLFSVWVSNKMRYD
jgi:hypothetical protein